MKMKKKEWIVKNALKKKVGSFQRIRLYYKFVIRHSHIIGHVISNCKLLTIRRTLLDVRNYFSTV